MYMYMTDSCSLLSNKGKNVLLCYDDDDNDDNDDDNDEDTQYWISKWIKINIVLVVAYTADYRILFI